MTYVNAVKYLNSLSKENANAERLHKILEALGSPQKQLKSIHIAGKQGKNSCHRMLASVLRQNGLRVGGFSPFQFADPREIISVDQSPISYAVLADLISRISKLYKELFPSVIPSFYEVLCSAAMLCFSESSCDVVIFEKSLHKSDAANLTEPPILSIITSMGDEPVTDVSYDEVLRKGTLEAITSPQHSGAYADIYESCVRLGIRLTLPIYSELEIRRINLHKTSFSYKGVEYLLRSFAPIQLVYAITVIEAARALSRVGLNLTEEGIARGLSSVRLAFKCEALSIRPTIILNEISPDDSISSVSAALAQIKDEVDGKFYILIDEDCQEDRSSLYSLLASSGISPEPISEFPRNMTPSRAEKHLRTILSSLADEKNPDSALIIMGEAPFITSVHDAIRRQL